MAYCKITPLFPLSVWFFGFIFHLPFCYFILVLWLLGVSFIAYPTCLGVKRLCCCCTAKLPLSSSVAIDHMGCVRCKIVFFCHFSLDLTLNSYLAYLNLQLQSQICWLETD
jgi:hypothetical protein